MGMRYITSSEEFKWEKNSYTNEDFKCTTGEYMLRAEKMDRGVWWWRVYHKDECLTEHLNETCSSKAKAMGLAEGFYQGITSLKRNA